MSIKQIRHRIVSACDGACSGNGTDNSPGGWGVAISYGNDIVKLSGYKARTTNNEMELTAMLEALRKIKTLPEVKESSVEIYSDSAYVVGCFEEKWYINWEKNGWINSQKQPVKKPRSMGAANCRIPRRTSKFRRASYQKNQRAHQQLRGRKMAAKIQSKIRTEYDGTRI